jgi:hypothetical protein
MLEVSDEALVHHQPSYILKYIIFTNVNSCKCPLPGWHNWLARKTFNLRDLKAESSSLSSGVIVFFVYFFWHNCWLSQDPYPALKTVPRFASENLSMD